MLGEYRLHHAVTPATDRTTNYFVAFSRTFAPDDQSVVDEITNVFRAVIAQDIDATESIVMRRSEEPTELLVRGDAHAMQGRRKLEKLIESEAQSRTPAKHVDSNLRPS